MVEADPRLGYAIMPGAATLCRGDLGARYRCPYIDVQFVSVGEYDDSLEQKHIGGYTRWGMGDDGSIQAHPFDDMEAAVAHLVDDSVHPG